MNRILRIVLCASLLILTGCSSLQSYDQDWINSLLFTPTPVPAVTSTTLPQPTPATQSVTEQPQPAVTEPTSLLIWLPPQFNPNLNAIASTLLKQRLTSFEAEHPGYVIDVRVKSEDGEANLLNSLAITSMAAPEAVPDLIALPRASLEAAAQKRLVQPLDGLSADIQSTQWFPYARELGKVDGTTYGLPFAGDALVIIYRPELVWIKNWDSILLSESHLTFAGADPEARVGLALYVSAGGELQDAQGKPTLDQEILSRVLELFAKGMAADIFPDASSNIATEEQAMQEYRARRTEMVITQYSQFRPTQDGLLQPLMGLDVEHLTFATGWVWALTNQRPETQQITLELAEYLMAEDFLPRWIDESGYLPTYPSSLTGPDREFVTPVVQAAQLGPSNDVLLALGSLMQRAIIRVLDGEQPDVVARSIVEELK
jgi:multiple sugar transport system substrate-binding protein